MGKGGTKFEGEAIGVRGGRKKGFSGKEMKKNMEEYLKTGHHPDLEPTTNPIPFLPERDLRRPHVFMDISYGGKTIEAGRLVIEVFEDKIPLAARHFIGRCGKGASSTFQGSSFHKLVPDLAAYGGLSSKYKAKLQFTKNPKLRHVVSGAVSITPSGSEFAISLARALTMDESHHVVGRVHLGQEVLEQLQKVRTDAFEVPEPPLIVVACGPTNSEGTHKSLEEAAESARRLRETPQEAAVRLAAESHHTRGAVQEALQAALGRKRKAGEGSCGGGAGTGKRGSAGRGRGMLDDMLGELSSESEEGDD